MILLKKITIKEFLSHQDTTIEFGPTDQMLIDGASGAGKSTIFDAIIWALYGQGRVDNRSLVRRGQKKATVILELTQTFPQLAAPYNKEEIVITRTTTPKGKHELSVTTFKPEWLEPHAHALTGVRELQEWIDKELVGASYLLFINSVAYTQGNVESFVAQTAPKRKELLLEIVKAEDYSKYYEKARQTLSALSGEEQRAQGQLVELEAAIQPLRTRIASKEGFRTHLEAEKVKLKDIVPKRESLEAQKAKYLAVSQTVAVLDNVLKGISYDVEVSDSALKAKSARVLDKKPLIKTLASVPKCEEDIKTSTEALALLRSILTGLSQREQVRNAFYARKPVVQDRDAEIKRLNDNVDFLRTKRSCPSGDSCPYEARTKADIDHGIGAAAMLVVVAGLFWVFRSRD